MRPTFRPFATFGVVLLLTPSSARAIARAATDPGVSAPSAANVTLAVADFSGQDKELGRFLADTLLTDLAQSSKLRLVERAEIRQAFTELKLQSTGLTEPAQVQKVGKLLGAQRLIVGSFLLRDGLLLVNTRLLDVQTGRVTPGGAANVSGKRDNMLALIHKLAHRFHRRVTGADFTLDNEVVPSDPPATLQPRDDVAEPETVSAQEVDEFAGMTSDERRNAIDKRDYDRANLESSIPVVLHHAGETAEEAAIADGMPRGVSPETYTPGTHSVRPQHNVRVSRSVYPSRGGVPTRIAQARRDVAKTTRKPGSGLPAHPQVRHVAPVVRRPAPEPLREPQPDPDACTGLIVEAFGYPVERTMSTRILDEDGRVIYPDQRYLPDADFLQDKGMADYYRPHAEYTRAGSRPLIVEACGVRGDDVVVTREAGDRILNENRHGLFLYKWRVGIGVDRGR